MGIAPAGLSDERAQPIRPPWLVLPDYQCFGCSPHNSAGLRLSFWESADGDGLEAPLSFGREHESYPGIVHGGIVATVCDEIMGNLLVLRTGVTHFTVTLRTRFLTPLAVGAAYRCVATARPEPGAAGQRQAAAEVLDDAGSTVASATGTYQPASAEHSRQHLVLSDADRRLLEDAMPAVPTVPRGSTADAVAGAGAGPAEQTISDQTSGRDRG
jgi:acyl-coenzyme A thioesterase PaaI-like protein